MYTIGVQLRQAIELLVACYKPISHLPIHQCFSIEVDHVKNEETAGGIFEGRFLQREVKFNDRTQFL